MRKKFITNLGFLFFLNMLVKPFWILGIDRTVQNVVGPEEYGIYFTLLNFSFLFQIALDFGINNFNNRHISQEPERIGNYFSTTLIAKIIFSVVYSVIVFIAALGVRFDAHHIRILSLLIVFQVFMSFYTFLRSNVSAMHLFKTDSVLSVLDKLLSSIACGILLWGNAGRSRFTIEDFLWIQIISYFVSIAVAFIIVLRYSIKIEWQLRMDRLKEILRKSYPFALLGFLMTIYYRIDGVMINRMLGDRGDLEAGIYASAFRLLDSVNILGFMFAGLLLPMFSRMLARKESIVSLLELSYKLMFILSCVMGITFIFYRNEIMNALYLEADNYYGSIFGWLMVSFINISIVYIYGTLLTANGSLRKLNFIAISGVVINVVINLFLIPRNGALGAAIATVITQLFVTSAHILIANKQFKLAPNYTLWLRSFFFMGLIAGINYAISRTGVNWVAGMCISIALGFAGSLLAGLFRISEIRGFIHEAGS